MSLFRHPYSGRPPAGVSPGRFQPASALGSLFEYIGSACHRFEDVMTEPERPWLERVTGNIPLWHEYLAGEGLGMQAERLGCGLAFIVYDYEKRYQVLADYVSLFLTAEPAVSFMESAWLEPGSKSPGDQVGAAGHWFRRFQWDRVYKSSGPDEHIGLQTSFCGWLYEQAADRPEASPPGRFEDKIFSAPPGIGQNAVNPRLADLTAFVREHYGLWAPECFMRLSEQSATDYWRDLLQLGAILAQRLTDACQDPERGVLL